MQAIELEHASFELPNYTVLESILRVPVETRSELNSPGKRHRSRHTTKAGDKAHARKNKKNVGGTGKEGLDSR